MLDFVEGVVQPVITTGLLLAVLTWLSGRWIGGRIDASIKAEYDRQKFKLESEHKRREKAQIIAELLSEWMSSPIQEAMTQEQRKKLNRLSFEATLWLPDDIANELGKVLQHHPSAKSLFELILRVRTLLGGEHSLTLSDVTTWDRYRELPNRGLPAGYTNGQIVVRGIKLECNGQETDLALDSLVGRFVVPAQTSVIFLLNKDGRPVGAYSPAVQSINVIERIASDGDVVDFRLEVFPQDVANGINRTIYGNPN